jgi:hypothetical protein
MKKQFLGLALSAIVTIGLFGLASAQQVTGVLGSASATTTISGKQLPPPDPKFGGVIKQRGVGIDPVVAATGGAAEEGTQRAADHDR